MANMRKKGRLAVTGTNELDCSGTRSRLCQDYFATDRAAVSNVFQCSSKKALLEPADVLVDVMRGRYSTWTRIRINLQHVPPQLRPAQEALDPDEKMRSSS